MCIENLITKHKLLCNQEGPVYFSLSGIPSTKIKFVFVLIKSTQPVDIQLCKQDGTVIQTQSSQGTGDFEFVLFKNLELEYQNIYYVQAESTHFYEINTAEICLCKLCE